MWLGSWVGIYEASNFDDYKTDCHLSYRSIFCNVINFECKDMIYEEKVYVQTEMLLLQSTYTYIRLGVLEKIWLI